MTPDESRVRDLRRIAMTVRPGRPFSVNDVRDLITAAGLQSPSLGALFRALVHDGLLVPTGRVVPSTEPSARGRLVREYRRVPQVSRRAAA